jgi:hypothetical protein
LVDSDFGKALDRTFVFRNIMFVGYLQFSSSGVDLVFEIPVGKCTIGQEFLKTYSLPHTLRGIPVLRAGQGAYQLASWVI